MRSVVNIASFWLVTLLLSIIAPILIFFDGMPWPSDLQYVFLGATFPALLVALVAAFFQWKQIEHWQYLAASAAGTISFAYTIAFCMFFAWQVGC